MFSPITDILDELRAGRMIVLTDDEDRENEGDLVLPAQMVTPDALTFMLSVARGYMCLSLTKADCDRLELAPQAPLNTSVRGTAFTISIDGHPRHGVTTGVSARDRTKTITLAIDPDTGPEDFVRPGHVNPLRARDGGVLVRTGQTEGSVDLCRLAGLHPSAIIIEIMRDDGEMARLPDLVKLCNQHNLKVCSVAQVIEHRLARESLIKRMEPVNGSMIETPLGPFNLIAYESIVNPLPHLALTVGGIGRLDDTGTPVAHPEPTLIRMHRRCLLGDIFDDLSSSSVGSTGQVLRRAMQMIQDEARAGRGGAIVYLRPEGVGDNLAQRLMAIRRPDAQPGADTPDLTAPNGPAAVMHRREFGIGGQILRDLGLSKLRLLTNSQTDLPGLDAFGLTITERVSVLPS